MEHPNIIRLLLTITSVFLLQGCDTTHKAMDIVSPNSVVDDNFLLKNPVWGIIADKRATDPPFPSQFCDCNSGNPDDWINAPDCTSQSVEYNEPTGGKICPDGGHMNYFPITYEANVCWGDHSGLDDDYNFRLHRKDKALETAGWDWMQTEFDSDETVDDWDDTETWWNMFHHDKVDDGDASAKGEIDGKFAIVIAEAGIDLEHGCHIELHPVYAMFIHIKDDPNNDHWAFFVRNWGNQGYCGSKQCYYRNPLAGDNTITIRIPHENAMPKGFTHNIRSVNDDNKKTFMLFDFVQDALVLTFRLDEPEEHTTIVGDINIQWEATGNSILRPRNDENKDMCKEKNDPGSNMQELKNPVEAKLMKLDTSSRKELLKALANRFGNRGTIRKDSTIVRRSSIDRRHLSRSKLKKIDYSKISYMVTDTATERLKSQRSAFIQEFLKGKGIN